MFRAIAGTLLAVFLISGPGVRFDVERMMIDVKAALAEASGSYGLVSDMPPAMAKGYVKAIQEELRDRGYAAGPADGIDGTLTKYAISAYQRDHGLEDDGRASKSLLDHMYFALGRHEGERPLRAPAQAAADPQLAALQELLREAGYDPGPVDGLIGPQTRQAIRLFQRDYGLPITGRPTPELEQSLRSALAGAAPEAAGPEGPGTAPQPEPYAL